MKQRIRICLLTALALTLLCGAALANQWGLPGGLLDITEGTNDYDEYSMGERDQDTATNHPKDFAVFIMRNRYHYELNTAWKDSGKWSLGGRFTRAVYQPDDDRGEPKITKGTTIVEEYDDSGEIESRNTETFTLDYGEEHFTFYFWADEWYLLSARVVKDGAVCEVALNDKNLLTFTDASGSCVFDWGSMYLPDFDISLFPRSVEEVRTFNANSAFLPYGYVVDMNGEKQKGLAAVYTAPDESSYRAAKGKAAVSLADDWTILETAGDWQLVQYEVSRRTSRVGWIHSGVKSQYNESFEDAFAHVPATLAVDSCITDDPLVSEYALAKLPAGTSLTCLLYADLFDPNYVYVETTIEGKRACGYVPVSALSFADRTYVTELQTELAGDWIFYAGGGFYADGLRLNADGTGERYFNVDYGGSNPTSLDSDNLALEDRFTWQVASVTANDGYTWNDTPYRIIFTNDDGRVYAYGLNLETVDAAEMMCQMDFPYVADGENNAIGFTNDEGGGGFLRVK